MKVFLPSKVLISMFLCLRICVQAVTFYISAEVAALSCPNKITCNGSLVLPYPNITFPLSKIMQSSPSNIEDTILLYDQVNKVSEAEFFSEKLKSGVSRIIFDDKNVINRRKKLKITGAIGGEENTIADLIIEGDTFAFNLSNYDMSLENIRIIFENLKYKDYKQSFIYLPKSALNCKLTLSNINIKETFMPSAPTNKRNNSNALIELSRKTPSFELNIMNCSLDFNFTTDTVFLAVFNMTDEYDTSLKANTRILNIIKSNFSFEGRTDLSTPKGVSTFSLLDLMSVNVEQSLFLNSFNNHSLYFINSILIIKNCEILIANPRGGSLLNFIILSRLNKFNMKNIIITEGLTPSSDLMNNTVFNITRENEGDITNLTIIRMKVLDVLRLKLKIIERLSEVFYLDFLNNISIFSSDFIRVSGRIATLKERNIVLVRGCNFYKINNAFNHSAIYLVLKNTLTLLESTLSKVGYYSSFYSIITAGNNNNALISSTTFKECSAQIGGCIQFKDHTNLSLLDCTFLSNRALNNLIGGGAFYVGSFSNIIINNCYFYNHTSTYGGVGFMVNNNSILIKTMWILFSMTTSGDCPGILVKSYNRIQIRDLVSKDGFSYGNGGAINLNSYNELTFDNIIAVNHSLNPINTNSGGSIKLSDNCIGTMTNVFIFNSSAKYSGGAFLYLEGSSILNIIRTIIIQAKSYTYSGVITVRGSSIFNVDDIVIVNSTATVSGGFMLMASNSSIFGNRLYLLNVSTEDTGGVFFMDLKVAPCMIRNSFFLLGKSNNYGGILYSRDPWEMIFDNSVFVNYTSSIGGAFNLGFRSLISITNCFFENILGDNGGTFYFDFGCIISFVNNSFFRSQAIFEGGVLLSSFSTSLYIDKCIFHDTKANKGGALNLKNKCKIMITHSKFFNVTTNSKLGGVKKLIFSLGNNQLNFTENKFLLLTEIIIADDSPPFSMEFYRNVVEMSPLFSLKEVFTFQSIGSTLNFKMNTFSCTFFKAFDSFITTTNERPIINLIGNMFSLNLQFRYFLYIDHSGFSILISQLSTRRMKLRVNSLLNIFRFKTNAPLVSSLKINEAAFFIGETNNLYGGYLLLNSATSILIHYTTIFITKGFHSCFLKSLASVQHNLSFDLKIKYSNIINNDRSSEPVPNTDYKIGFFEADNKLRNISLKGNFIKLGNSLFQTFFKTRQPKYSLFKQNIVVGNRFERVSENLGLFFFDFEDYSADNYTIHFKGNRFCFNSMVSGAIIYFNLREMENKFIDLKMNNNKFLSNKVKTKGAVIYMNFSSTGTFEEKESDKKKILIKSLLPNISKNEFRLNRAAAGPLLYIEQIKTSRSSEALINSFRKDNKILKSYSSDTLGDISSSINYIRISKYSLMHSNVFNTDPVTVYMEVPIVNNAVSEDCYFYITSYDTYGNIVKFNSILETNNYIFYGENEPMVINLKRIKIYLTIEVGALCGKKIFVTETPNFTKQYQALIDPHFTFSQLGKLTPKDNPDMTVVFRLAKCLRGEYFNSKELGCFSCPTNTYSLVAHFSSSFECKACSLYDPFYCYGGDERSPKYGYWRSQEKSNKFLRCPNSLSCLGDPQFVLNLTSIDCLNCSISGLLKSESIYEYRKNSTYSGKCQRGYEGVLCTECKKPEYGLSDFYQCYNCSNKFYLAKDIILLLLKTAFILIILSKLVNLNEKLSQFSVDSQSFSSSLKRNIDRAFLLRVLLQHVQFLLIVKSFPSKIVPELEMFLSIILELTSPNISTAYTTECFLRFFGNEVQPVFVRLFFVLIFSLFIILSLLLISTYKAFKNRLNSTHNYQENFKNFACTIITDRLPPIIMVHFITNYVGLLEPYVDQFFCINIGDNENKDTHDMRLIRDLSISCYSDRHLNYIYFLALPMTILIGVLFPAYLAYRIFREKRKLGKKSTSLFKLLGFCFVFKKKDFYLPIIFVIIRFQAFILARPLFTFAIIKDETNSAGMLLFFILVSFYFIQNYYDPFKKRKFNQIHRIESISNMINVSNVVAVIFRIILTTDGTVLQNILLIIFISTFNFIFLIIWLYYFFFAHKKNVKSLMTNIGSRLSFLSLRAIKNSQIMSELVSPIVPRKARTPKKQANPTLEEVESKRGAKLLKTNEIMKAQIKMIEEEEEKRLAIRQNTLYYNESLQSMSDENFQIEKIRGSFVNEHQIINQFEELPQTDDNEIPNISQKLLIDIDDVPETIDCPFLLIKKKFKGNDDEEAYLELEYGMSDCDSSLVNIELLERKSGDWAVISFNSLEKNECSIKRTINLGVRYMGESENLLKGVKIIFHFLAKFRIDEVLNRKCYKHEEKVDYQDFISIISRTLAGGYAKDFNADRNDRGNFYVSPSYKLNKEQIYSLRKMIEDENNIGNFSRLSTEYTLQITYKVLLPFTDCGLEYFKAIIKLSGLMIIIVPLIKTEEITEKMVEYIRVNFDTTDIEF